METKKLNQFSNFTYKLCRMKQVTFWVFLSTLFLFQLACTSSKNTANDTDEKIDKLERVDNPVNTLSLADHIQRLPGVSVRRNGQIVEVTLKGMKSFSSSGEPLFVVDGQRYTTYAAAAAVVDVNDIKSVRVLRSVNERAEYGMVGAQGVIEITLKKK
jgi:hypothetical protein